MRLSGRSDKRPPVSFPDRRSERTRKFCQPFPDVIGRLGVGDDGQSVMEALRAEPELDGQHLDPDDLALHNRQPR